MGWEGRDKSPSLQHLKMSYSFSTAVVLGRVEVAVLWLVASQAPAKSFIRKGWRS